MAEEDQFGNVTVLLNAVAVGEPDAENRLWSTVYDKLRSMAARRMASERDDHTLQPTALVNEAFLRLSRQDRRGAFENRAHFFSAAGEAMRRILIDRARKKNALRREGKRKRVELDEFTLATSDSDDCVIAVSDALERLESIAPDKANIVKLSYFVGLKQSEIAEVLNVSVPTVKRHWAYARSWLGAAIKESLGTDNSNG